MDELPQIHAKHLARLGVVYTRTATMAQNEAELAEQKNRLVQQVNTLGWPAERIETVEDIAMSGMSSRPGYQRLLQSIQRGEVGIVLVTDIARLSRNFVDVEKFLAEAISRDVLIHCNGSLLSAEDLKKLYSQMRDAVSRAHWLGPDQS